MRFQDPLWLLLLLPLAAGFAWKLLTASRHLPDLPYPDLSLIEAAAQRPAFELKVLPSLKFAAFALMVLALARPQKLTLTLEPPRPVVDIMICLDTSLSMSALDFDPKNRLEAAQEAAAEFIRKRPLDRIGLVIFGGKAIVQCPLTLDHESLIELLSSVPMNATQTDGTAVGTALALAAERLAESEAKSKVVVLLTDGRNNAGNLDPVTAARAAADLNIKIYAIGAAVPGGGLLPVEDPVFGKRLVRMAEDLDEPALTEIARLTRARYFRVTSQRRFSEIYDEIDAMEKTKVDAAALTSARHVPLPFLLPALILLLCAVFLKTTVWRSLP